MGLGVAERNIKQEGCRPTNILKIKMISLIYMFQISVVCFIVY